MFSLPTVREAILTCHAGLLQELQEETEMGPGKTGALVGRHKPIVAI